MDRENVLSALDEEKSDPAVDRAYSNIPDEEDAGFWWRLVHLEPALWRGLVFAIAGVLATFGLVFTDANQMAIVTGITAIAAMIQALWVRKSVTPNAKVVVYKPSPVDEPERLAPGQAVSTNIPSVANAAADNPDGEKDVLDLPFPERW